MNLDNSNAYLNNVDALTGYTMGFAHAIAESVGITTILIQYAGTPEPNWE